MISGKAAVDGESTSEQAPSDPAGVMATACRHRRSDATREAPAVSAVTRSTGSSRETGRAVWGGGEARSTDEAG